MVLNALLVSLVYYFSSSLSIVFGVFHFNRPIIVAPLVGLVLGDLQTGIILGATFEAVFLGVIAIGGSMPADATLGSVFGTAVAILGGLDPELALAVAMPVSVLGMTVGIIPMSLFYPALTARSLKHSANGNVPGLKRMAFIMGFVMFLFNAVVMFIGVYLGAEAVGAFLMNMPMWLVSGLAAGSSILPAIGMALMLNLLFDKKIIVFFFLGFVLSIYLGVNPIAIAVMAVVLGVYTFFNMPKTVTVPAGNNETSKASEDDEFFE